MKVLQFAFDSSEDNSYLPHNYNKNCVVYTGTHDNDTINGWLEAVNEKTLKFAKKYLHTKNNDLREELIISAMSSVADTCILTMQDLIGLGSSARMNIPSTVGGNWMWRAEPDYITEKIKATLSDLTKTYSRERQS
jgi:4-alpha-glucanotransferase